MGVSLKQIRNLRPIVERGLLPAQAAVLEYGAQNIHWSSYDQELELADFVRQMRRLNGLDEIAAEEVVAKIGSGGLMAEVIENCGFRYTALDITPFGRNVLVFDLNTDKVPKDLQESFDLVTNFGTTEHVINQLNCFSTLHEFTRPGGLIYHDLPMGGYFFHGYFSYTPLFFFHLAAANEYEILYRYYWKAPGDAQSAVAPPELNEHGWPETWFQDVGIEFIFRKTRSAPFCVPIELGTSGPIADDREGMRVISGTAVPGSDA